MAVQTGTGDRLGEARTHLVAEAVHRLLGNDRAALIHQHRASELCTEIGVDRMDNACLVLGASPIRDTPTSLRGPG